MYYAVSGPRKARGRISENWLAQYVQLRQLRQLLLYDVSINSVGAHIDVLRRNKARHPFVCLLQKCFACREEVKKLFRPFLAAAWPQPPTFASGKDEAIVIFVILAILWFFLYKLARYNGIPVVLILMSVLIAIYHFITTKTIAGRQIYALGGNAKAAKLSGINTKLVFFWVYANMGLLSAIAGIVLSARNSYATPKAGDGFEMDAIAACYIGGAATSGGIGTIIGAVVGAFTMGILNNGMSLVGLSTDIQKIVKGLVLLGAVTFDLLSKQKKNA